MKLKIINDEKLYQELVKLKEKIEKSPMTSKTFASAIKNEIQKIIDNNFELNK